MKPAFFSLRSLSQYVTLLEIIAKDYVLRILAKEKKVNVMI